MPPYGGYGYSSPLDVGGAWDWFRGAAGSAWDWFRDNVRVTVGNPMPQYPVGGQLGGFGGGGPNLILFAALAVVVLLVLPRRK